MKFRVKFLKGPAVEHDVLGRIDLREDDVSVADLQKALDVEQLLERLTDQIARNRRVACGRMPPRCV